ncbi:conserved unknown protein [Ectocarpus siliculosus]|uniref:Uncharacterized protein n=1 Tax=Ectocarpus siliculosus TaxID=2880 RepID=D7FMD9_ECTSI|nr:conserved unknown protein [Ectocarpus siliculosus]|eukprot:CBJ34248.1 conserved unknown protein [Ectocarpus siliculosus]
MTGVALSSLHKFLLYGFIRKDCPRVKEGITLVAQAISRCHFEETDPESDELVLMKLLELSALCLRCEVGDLLTDESCWNIFVACYNLYHITTDDKSFGLLRDTAGNTLAHIVLMLFSRPRVSRASKSAAPGGAATADATVAAGGAVLHETLGQKAGAEARDCPPTEPSKAPPTPGGDRDGLAQASPPPPPPPRVWGPRASSKGGDQEGNHHRQKNPFGGGKGVAPPLKRGEEEEPWASPHRTQQEGARPRVQ